MPRRHPALMEETADGPSKDPLRLFGARLREAREARGMSQADLAQAMGTQPNSVSRWEKGENEMGILFLLAAARALDTTVQALLEPSPVPPSTRTASAYYISPERMLALRNAKSREEAERLLPTSPPVGVQIEPADIQVSEAEFEAKQREADALFEEKIGGALRRLLQRLRGVN